MVLVVVTAILCTAGADQAARLLLVATLCAGIVYVVAGIAAGPGLQGRYSAFGGGPNVFGRILSLATIAAVTLALMRRRWIALMPVPLLLFGVFLAGSRGAMVSLLITATAVFLFAFRRIRVSLLLAGGVLGASLTALVWSGIEGSDKLSSRYSPDVVADTGFSHRPQLLSYARDVFIDNPLVGAGLDGFYAEVGNQIGIAYPHNFVASVAAEGGLAGLTLLGFIGIAIIRDASPWSALPAERIGAAACAFYVFVGSMFSGDYYDCRFMWIFVVVLVSGKPAASTVLDKGRMVRQ